MKTVRLALSIPFLAIGITCVGVGVAFLTVSEWVNPGSKVFDDPPVGADRYT